MPTVRSLPPPTPLPPSVGRDCHRDTSKCYEVRIHVIIDLMICGYELELLSLNSMLAAKPEQLEFEEILLLDLK